MNQINNAEKSLADLADVIKNKSSLVVQNPSLSKVVFDYGSFGDLTTEKSAGGSGIVHIIQRRAEIDGLSEEDIASLLLKIKDITETERVTGYDETGTRAFINKDGIRVLLQKNWNKSLDNWLVSGYGIMDSAGNLSLEAAETIQTVNAQYGYKPEHSLLREQVGAVIASVNNIRQQQLKVKKLKASTKIEKGTKRVSSANPTNIYEKAVLKDSPKNCSDKELLTALASSTHARNALKNTNNSELYKNTRNKSILESAGDQKLIDKILNELQARGYALNIESTFNETNVHFQHQIFIDIGNGKEKKLLTETKAVPVNRSNKPKEKEKIMPGQNTIHAFTDDKKKMSDFNELTKREFLDSHSDVNEADYDATVAELKEKGEYTAPWNTIKEIVGTGGKAFANEVQYQRELHQDDDYTNDADGNFMRKFDATYFAAEQNLSHRGLDMDTYRDLFGDISKEKATEIEAEKRDILGPEVVEKLVKGPEDINGPAGFEDFTDIQQAYDRALAKSKTYQKIAAEELQQAIGKRDNLFVTSIADYLNSVVRHYDEKREPETAKKCEDILSEALFTAETEINTEAFKTLLENGADITYRKTEIIDSKEHKANILHYIAADDNIEALSLLMYGSSNPFDRLTAGEKLSLLREQNFEGRTPLEVSENYYREEPSRYEPDMVMPDVMRELAYQEENLMSHVPLLVLTDKLTGNILMVEQADGDVREVSLFDKNKKLVDHDISSGFRSSLEAARNNMAEYEKHGLWGNFYEYEKVPAAARLIKPLKDSRDEFLKSVDAIGEEIEKNGIELYAVNNITPNFKTDAKFEMFIPGKLLSDLGIETEHGEPFEDKLVKIQMFIGKDGKEDGYHVDLAGNEDIQDDFTANAGKRFDAVIGKIQDKILEKYPYKTINQMIRLEEARHFPVMDRVDLRDYLNAHKTKEHDKDFEYGFQRPDAILEMLSKQGKKLLFDKENDKIFEISKNADFGFSNIGTLSELEDVTAKQLLDEERGTRTVTQSVTFPAHFIMSEKRSLSLLEILQKKYGFGENDFEQFVTDGDVDIHFAAPVPKEYQFPKSKTDEWVKSVCNDLEKKFGSTDVAIGMDGSERTERVFETEEEARRFHKGGDGGPGGAPSDGPGYYLKKKEPEQSDINLPPPHTHSLEQQAQNPDEPPLTAESIFKNFIKEANDEYKELKLIYQAAAKALKSTPPEQRKILDAELLKRGARSPEKLASIMQDAFRKLDEPEKWQKKSRADNSYDRGR